MARNMVVAWGMSEKLGPLSYKANRDPWASMWEGGGQNHYSEDTAREIDEEVQRIVRAGKEKANSILEAHRDQIEVVVAALREKEVLDKKEFEALLGEGPDKEDSDRSEEEPSAEVKEADTEAEDTDRGKVSAPSLEVPTPTS